MKRIVLIAALGLLGLAPAASAAHHGFGIRLTKCHRAVATIDRSFHLRAAMRPTPATKTMAIRFDLQVRRGRHGPWHSYRSLYGHPADGFGTWYRSALVDRYRYLRTVNGLEGPENRAHRHVSVSFRVRAGFRWSDRHGDVLKTRHRPTRGCFQPELRPNLQVAGLHAAPLRGGYIATVRNHGRSGAGAFDLDVSAGEVTRMVSFPGLGAGGTLHAFFSAAELGGCTAGDVTAVVDPADTQVAPRGSVDEADEVDNSRTTGCS